MLYPSHRSEGQYIFESNNEVVAIDAEQFIKIKQERDQVEQNTSMLFYFVVAGSVIKS
jgi:hypothetical protein